MSAGLQVFSENGNSLVIDSNFKNSTYLGTFILNPSITNIVTITVSGAYPVIAVVWTPVNSATSPATLHKCCEIGRTLVSNNSWQITLHCTGQGTVVAAFGDSAGSAQQLFGLEVFNDQSEIVFSSARKYLKVVETVAMQEYSGQQVQVPHAAYDSFCVALSQSSRYQEQGTPQFTAGGDLWPGEIIFHLEAIGVNNGTVEVGFSRIGWTGWDNWGPGYYRRFGGPPPTIIFIDTSSI